MTRLSSLTQEQLIKGLCIQDFLLFMSINTIYHYYYMYYLFYIVNYNKKTAYSLKYDDLILMFCICDCVIF